MGKRSLCWGRSSLFRLKLGDDWRIHWGLFDRAAEAVEVGAAGLVVV